uniref:DUF3395 domain-containing protein n=1 Tax=Panagrellus redivivus TaxID=6233 RepID=A0A7E4VA57_PANRE
MLNRFIETLNEADEVRSLYAFQDTNDDVESVYAFDAPNKRCPTNWHVFEGCSCGTLTDYEMDTSDDDSDDVEPCDAFKGSNENGKDVNVNDMLTALYDILIEPLKCGLQWTAPTILSYLCLLVATTLAKNSAHAFWSPIFFSIWGCLPFVIAHRYNVDNKSDLNARNPKVDTFETNETDEDIASVYAFNDLNDANPTDTDKDTDDVASVYAFDAADNDEIQSSDGTEGSVSSESSNSFGFTIPNLGEGEQYGYHADSDDGRFDFYNDNVTCVRLVTGKSLTLAFDGQNLKVVIHDGKAYTSFDAMPSDVADILITTRAGIIDLVF